MNAMAILNFEPSKERTFLRVKIACDVHERMERYRAFCGALELANLVERALVYVMDKDADVRTQEKEGTTLRGKGGQRQRAKWVSPADKTGGAPQFFCHT